MPRKNDKDNEQLPEEEPTDEVEEFAEERPSGVGRVWNAVGKAADATTSAAGKAADATTSAVGKVADTTTLAAGNTLDAVLSAPNAAFNTVFPECAVPAFMLPTGPGVEDYVFVFKMEEMLDNLRSGVFVRPKIEVWSGWDNDYDAEHFIIELEQDFERQLGKTRESLLKVHRAKAKQLESRERKVSRGKGITTVTSLVGATEVFVVTALFPPAGILLLVAFGLTTTSQWIRLIWQSASVEVDKSRAQAELESELGKLEKTYNRKNRNLQRAVKRLEVKVHPRIQEIARLICEAEGAEFSVSEPVSGDIPDVEPYLRHPQYLDGLPKKYIGFLG